MEPLTRRRIGAVFGAALVAGSLGWAFLAFQGVSGAISMVVSKQVGTAFDAAAFCSRLSIAKIDSIVGAKVSLFETATKGKILACIYEGVPGNMSIETETGIPLSPTSSLSAAEAGTKAEFPAGQKIIFAAVPSLGRVAFSWTTHSGTVKYSGLNVYKGSRGYFVEMGGRLKLSPLKKLVALAIAAGSSAKQTT